MSLTSQRGGNFDRSLTSQRGVIFDRSLTIVENLMGFLEAKASLGFLNVCLAVCWSTIWNYETKLAIFCRIC